MDRLASGERQLGRFTVSCARNLRRALCVKLGGCFVGWIVAGGAAGATVAHAADAAGVRAVDAAAVEATNRDLAEIFPGGAICAHQSGGVANRGQAPGSPGASGLAIPSAPSSEVRIYEDNDLQVITWTGLLADPVTETVPFEVRAGVVGITIRAEARGSGDLVSVELISPEGEVIACHECPDTPAVGEVLSGRGATQMPSTNRAGWELDPGGYEFRVRVLPNPKPVPETIVDVRATFRTEAAASVEHRLDLNFIYLPGCELSVKIATAEPLFDEMLELVSQYLEPTGISLGNITHVDLDRSEFSRIATWEEAGWMFRTSREVGAHRSLNVYCVEFFDAPLNPVVGLAGGIPGPAFNGTRDSGIAIRTSPFFLCTPGCLPVFASLFAHEIGHYVGMYHTSEANLENWDPFSDTPECHEANLRDCPDWSNVMFPVIHDANEVWSPGQVAVAATHPLIHSVPVIGGSPSRRIPQVDPSPQPRVSFAPSPFRESVRIDWAPAGSAAVRVGIYDVSGRRVRSLSGGSGLMWDGRDEIGVQVAAGTYFVRLNEGRAAGTARVVKLP